MNDCIAMNVFGQEFLLREIISHLPDPRDFALFFVTFGCNYKAFLLRDEYWDTTARFYGMRILEGDGPSMKRFLAALNQESMPCREAGCDFHGTKAFAWFCNVHAHRRGYAGTFVERLPWTHWLFVRTMSREVFDCRVMGPVANFTSKRKNSPQLPLLWSVLQESVGTTFDDPWLTSDMGAELCVQVRKGCARELDEEEEFMLVLCVLSFTTLRTDKVHEDVWPGTDGCLLMEMTNRAVSTVHRIAARLKFAKMYQ